jgi:hypothetical protein
MSTTLVESTSLLVHREPLVLFLVVEQYLSKIFMELQKQLRDSSNTQVKVHLHGLLLLV